MKDKTSWFVRMEDDGQPGIFGIGECGPLPGLSAEFSPEFDEHLQHIVDSINAASLSDHQRLYEFVPREYPSILFGVETASRDLQNGGRRVIFDNDFQSGAPIPINGLIWMGDLDFMMEQINQKISQGFRCIKLKVGGLDFERECDILGYIRKRYYRESITLRLDANGAFKTDDVLYKLEELARFQIHSIEQPVKAGRDEMEEVCRKSPIPVALDEELIGVHTPEDKSRLLEKLKPPFIVLKPSLHGGFRGCDEWISQAASLQIGWWITSALESSVGLNAICQYTAQFNPGIPQGLGTGAIYADNFPSPLVVRDGQILYDTGKPWVLQPA